MQHTIIDIPWQSKDYFLNVFSEKHNFGRDLQSTIPGGYYFNGLDLQGIIVKLFGSSFLRFLQAHRLTIPMSWHPWDWYINLPIYHKTSTTNYVDRYTKYTSPMDGMGMSWHPWDWYIKIY